MSEKNDLESEEKEGKRPLPRDENEGLIDPIKQVIENFWEDAWRDPKVEEYKLLDYINLSLLARTYLQYLYSASEGEFGITKYLRSAPFIEIGIVGTTYGGIEGAIAEDLIIYKVGEEIPKSIMNKRLYSILSPEKDGMLAKLRDKGLEIFKYYTRHPEEKRPEVYVKGESKSLSKYFKLVSNPWEYPQVLMRVPEKMFSNWSKRIGRENIEDANIQLNYRNEFGITLTKTREFVGEGVQKEIRMSLEGVINIKDIGEVGDAIGSSGGIESLTFIHPYTRRKSYGWDAIEEFGEWIGEKALAIQRAEKPDDIFKEERVNVLLPSTLLGAAMSYFFSGRKMWEAIKNQKGFLLHRLIGQKVAPSDFYMKIDGRQETAWGEGLYGSLEMDSEGTEASEKTIIEAGKLVRFFNSRLYFLPVAERSALAKQLIEEENPLTATARRTEIKGIHDTIPTNLYIYSTSGLSMDDLLDRLGTRDIHLYVASASVSSVDINSGNIKIRVDMGNPIQGKKINRDIVVSNMTLSLNFNEITEKLKYMGDRSTETSDAFNLEVDGKVYEVSVTGPYVALFDISKEKKWRSEEEELFKSKHLYSHAIPRYLTSKRNYLKYGRIDAMPERLKEIGIITKPFTPREMVRSKIEVTKSIM